MTTIEAQKADLLQQMEDTANSENWELLEQLARRGLEMDPTWFDAATRWQAACIEIAARDAEHEPWAASMGYISYATAAENVKKSVMRALEANRLVRRLVDAQQTQ